MQLNFVRYCVCSVRLPFNSELAVWGCTLAVCGITLSVWGTVVVLKGNNVCRLVYQDWQTVILDCLAVTQEDYVQIAILPFYSWNYSEHKSDERGLRIRSRHILKQHTCNPPEFLMRVLLFVLKVLRKATLTAEIDFHTWLRERVKILRNNQPVSTLTHRPL